MYPSLSDAGKVEPREKFIYIEKATEREKSTINNVGFYPMKQ